MAGDGHATSDEDLMLAYARGEMRAFETLYERHRGPLYRYLLRSIRDRALADEVFQEAWSRVVAVRERYRPEAKFSTWLTQIAHNLMVDHYRRQRPQAGAEETEAVLAALDAPEHEQPERELSAFEERRRLELALDELPPEQREAFLLRAEQGYGVEEIAEIAGVGRETAKSRLRYALAKLRERLSS